MVEAGVLMLLILRPYAHVSVLHGGEAAALQKKTAAGDHSLGQEGIAKSVEPRIAGQGGLNLLQQTQQKRLNVATCRRRDHSMGEVAQFFMVPYGYGEGLGSFRITLKICQSAP